MIMTSKGPTKVDKRSLVVVGELPADFLRIIPSKSPHEFDPAVWHTQELFTYSQNSIRLSITIGQAQLTKNYGLTRMDPYCKVTVGRTIFETQTAVNGARNPIWNKVLVTSILPEHDHIFLDIFDERAFSDDSHIAWAKVIIPEKVFAGEQVNEWFPLSGSQGEHKEGAIHLVFTLLSDPAIVMALRSSKKSCTTPSEGPEAKVPRIPDAPLDSQGAGGTGNSEGTNEEEERQKISTLKDMFPSVDEVVIVSILEANRGNVDRSVNSLLEMQST